MPMKAWFVVAPGALALLFGGSVLWGRTAGEGRIGEHRLQTLERRLGYHLHGPTWLPYGGRAGERGPVQGRNRIMQDFSDDQERVLCILSQERRQPVRDAYHKRLFMSNPDARAEVNGQPAYFVTGQSGERRLFWFQDDTAIILSSTVMSDEEMARVAAGVR